MEEKLATHSQLKRSYFYRKIMLAFGIDDVFWFKKFVYENKVARLISFEPFCGIKKKPLTQNTFKYYIFKLRL